MKLKHFKCPNCEAESISLFKKAFLDVRSTYKCTKCNGTYGVPWYAGILAVTTMLGFFYVLGNIQAVTPLKLILGIVIAILSMAINVLAIPIIRK